MTKATACRVCFEALPAYDIEAGALKCSRCKWVERSKAPCADCGGPTGWPLADKRRPSAPRCQPCRRAAIAHGTVRGYRKGCRCDLCRGAKSREYAQRTQKSRPARDLRCEECGDRVAGRAGFASDGPVLHGPCRVTRERRTARRHREAAERLRLAAEGVPANPANAIVQGMCRQCGETFTARRAFSGLCSRRCREKVKSRGHWITDVDRRAIYERDGWTCQLCFEPVDPTLHYLDNMAASLDHIECRSWALIPDDSPRNLRLAHRLCNSMRGDESWSLAVSA